MPHKFVPGQPISTSALNRLQRTADISKPRGSGSSSDMQYGESGTAYQPTATQSTYLRIVKVTGTVSGGYSFEEMYDPDGDGTYTANAVGGIRSAGSEIKLVARAGSTFNTNDLVVARLNPFHPHRWEGLCLLNGASGGGAGLETRSWNGSSSAPAWNLTAKLEARTETGFEIIQGETGDTSGPVIGYDKAILRPATPIQMGAVTTQLQTFAGEKRFNGTIVRTNYAANDNLGNLLPEVFIDATGIPATDLSYTQAVVSGISDAITDDGYGSTNGFSIFSTTDLGASPESYAGDVVVGGTTVPRYPYAWLQTRHKVMGSGVTGSNRRSFSQLQIQAGFASNDAQAVAFKAIANSGPQSYQNISAIAMGNAGNTNPADPTWVDIYVLNDEIRGGSTSTGARGGLIQGMGAVYPYYPIRASHDFILNDCKSFGVRRPQGLTYYDTVGIDIDLQVSPTMILIIRGGLIIGRRPINGVTVTTTGTPSTGVPDYSTTPCLSLPSPLPSVPPPPPPIVSNPELRTWGRVIDSTGTPLTGRVVSIAGSTEPPTFVDSNGDFALGGITPEAGEDVIITLNGAGETQVDIITRPEAGPVYSDIDYSITVPTYQGNLYTKFTVTDPDSALTNVSVVRVTVTDGTTPISGRNVTIAGVTVATNSAGVADFIVAPTELTAVCDSNTGETAIWSTTNPTDSGTGFTADLALTAGQVTNVEFEVTLQTFAVDVAVLNQTLGGSPVVGRNVTIDGQTVATDGSGLAAFTAIPYGTHTVTLATAGGETYSWNIDFGTATGTGNITDPYLFANTVHVDFEANT